MDESGCYLLFGCWAAAGTRRGGGLGADSHSDGEWNGRYGSGVGRWVLVVTGMRQEMCGVRSELGREATDCG
jgi:hypothetical protein